MEVFLNPQYKYWLEMSSNGYEPIMHNLTCSHETHENMHKDSEITDS